MKIDIAALRELHAKATPGEWSYTVNAEGTRWILDSHAAHAIACGAGYEPINLTNAALIVAAHNALPALIAMVRELEGENADLKLSVVAFCGPWATEYAKDFGHPTAFHLHATHYDILEKCGARLDGFVRYEPTQQEPQP